MNKMKKLPHQERLKSLFRYEKETGKLFWLERKISDFAASKTRSAEHVCSLWNSKHAGKEALHHQEANGYLVGGVEGVRFKAHRIIWKLVHGTDPDFIDHINQCKTDNRIENLRDVSPLENTWNRRMKRTNKSGVVGVSFRARNEKWCVSAHKNGVHYYGGEHRDFDKAVAARLALVKTLGFFENHGRAQS